MRKGKVVIAGLCCALTLTSMGACGGSSSGSGGTKKVEFMTMQSTGTPQLKVITKLARAFEEKNPDIKIKVDPGTNNNENDIKVRLAGHNPPDIWATHGWSRDRYGNFSNPCRIVPGPRG